VASLLAVGGRAILSGFIERDRAMVVAAADEAGLTLLEVLREDGWCALIVTRGRTALLNCAAQSGA
jgi:ribosomal protein L11 methylase PrmA